MFARRITWINSLPNQAMYLPSQVHGNLLRFMFGIEVGLETHQFLNGVLFIIDVHCISLSSNYAEIFRIVFALILSP